MFDYIKVTLVSDFVLLRQGIKVLLEYNENVKIISEAADINECLEKLKIVTPHILIMDIDVFRGKKIVEDLDNIKNKYPNIKILLLSDNNLIQPSFNVISSSVDSIVSKNCDISELLEVIFILINDINNINNINKYNGINNINGFNDINSINNINGFNNINSINNTDNSNNINSKNCIGVDLNDKFLYVMPKIKPDIEKTIKSEKNYLTRRENEVLLKIADGMSNKEIAIALNVSERTVKNHISSIFKKIKVSDRTQAAIYAIKNHLVYI